MDRATLSELQTQMGRLADGDRSAFHPVFFSSLRLVVRCRRS